MSPIQAPHFRATNYKMNWIQWGKHWTLDNSNTIKASKHSFQHNNDVKKKPNICIDWKKSPHSIINARNLFRVRCTVFNWNAVRVRDYQFRFLKVFYSLGFGPFRGSIKGTTDWLQGKCGFCTSVARCVCVFFRSWKIMHTIVNSNHACTLQFTNVNS